MEGVMFGGRNRDAEGIALGGEFFHVRKHFQPEFLADLFGGFAGDIIDPDDIGVFA